MIASGEPIDIYLVSLDVEPAQYSDLARLLSAEELTRASRFRFDRDRRRFTVARGTLRQLLSGYLAMAPKDLEFAYGPHGKPDLKGIPSADILHFNLSHTANMALFAITRRCQVGIDLEHIRPDFATEEVITTVCTIEEKVALAGQAPAERRTTFFRYWTRKEAYIKARGTGFSLDPRTIGAERILPITADWFHLMIDSQPDTNVAVCDLALIPEYGAAIALIGDPVPLLLHTDTTPC